VRINRDGTVRQVFRGTSQYLYLPRLSPDGLLAAVDVRGEGGQYQVAIYDFERGQLTPFTYPAQDDNRHALWTGSKRIVWQSRREGTRQLFSQAIDGGEPERLTSFSAPSAEVETYTFPSSYCGDGRLLVGRLVPTSEIYVLKGVGAPAQNRTSDRLKLPVGADGGAALSPDCNWIAYVSDESGRREVYVREFPSLRNMHQISTGGGSEPMWNPDRAKHELFYRSGQDMMAADINEQGLPRRMPEILFRGLYNTAQGGYAARNYDVFPDGSFLMLKPQEQKPATQIHVVLGWSEQLKRLVPTEGP
jgi:serine/threonine-protein kinase